MSNMSAASSAKEVEGRLCQFSKTKMCKFHALGKCTKGEQCPFAHDSIDVRNLPDLRCTKLCKPLIQTGICNDKNCTYAHSKEELRSTGAFHKTKLCRFMQTGHCTLGIKCNFAHSALELREPETIDSSNAFRRPLMQSEPAPAFLPPPGLIGIENMVEGLLKSDDEADHVEDKQLPKPIRKGGLKSKEKEPAYVHAHFRERLDSWNLLEEKGTEGEDASLKDTGFGSMASSSFPWDYRSQWAASSALDFPSSHFAGEGVNSAYSSDFNSWSYPWSGSSMPSTYPVPGFPGSLFGGAFDPWDWRQFAAEADKPAPKMRSVRTSESTLCTLGDTQQQ